MEDKMYKPILKSKTLWGFGIAVIIALAQVLNIPYSDALVAEIVKLLSSLFGIYGLRDAIDNWKMYEDKIREISRPNWEGMIRSEIKNELIRIYTLLDWFIKNTLDNYLDQNARTVISSLKKDKPPLPVLDLLEEYEKKNKNREKILNKIKELKKNERKSRR